MFDVITIGSSTVDAFAKTECELITIRTNSSQEEFLAYPSGSKILINDLKFMIGGGGTNTAVACARLGLKTAYLGKIGIDQNADAILALLKKEKIKFIGARQSGQSGYSVILDSIEEDRTILTYKGVNDTLEANEIDFKKIRSKWIYVCSMMGKSFEATEKIVAFASGRRIKIAFNPSLYQAKQGVAYLKNILERTTLLVLNKEEAQMLVGNYQGKELLKKLRLVGPQIVAVTDGKNGVIVYDGAHFYAALPPKVKIVETTGAGDAFASSMMAGLIKANDIEFGIRLGLTNAASVIQYLGAKEILLTYKQALSEIKKFNIAVHKEADKNG
jgi:ribokinase